MWVGILENLSNWFAPRAINEVSRSFSNQDFCFYPTQPRAVQKQARRGSRSDVRQEFSKPKDYQMPRTENEVARLFSNCEFDIIPITTETVKN